MKGVPYAEAIRSVLWPTVVSRPDTAYAVGIMSQFIQNLGRGKKNYQLSWQYKEPMAYLWRQHKNLTRRVLQCGLG